MTAKNRLRERRAISPVIATVILVAVAITVAVAVSYWMGSLAGQYTSFEKIEIQSGYSEYTDPSGEVDGYWTITLQLKNTGSATATLTNVFVNDILVDQTNIVCAQIDPDPTEDAKVTIKSGNTATVVITINDNPYVTYSAGTTINVKLHSAGGMDYIKLIKLV